MLRMLWLRQRIPDTKVETTLVSINDRVVVMSATISVPGGGQGSGHVAVMLDGDTGIAQAIETAETRAIGRALDVLGYIVTESGSSGPQDRAPSPAPTPSPASRPTPIDREERRSEPPEHVRAIRAMRDRDQRPDPSNPDANGDAAGETTPEIDAPPDQPPTPPASTVSVPPDDEGDPELEDVSWTAFWGWARATYQLSSKGQLEDLLGQPVGNKTPGTLRQMLNAHYSEDTDDES